MCIATIKLDELPSAIGGLTKMIESVAPKKDLVLVVDVAQRVLKLYPRDASDGLTIIDAQNIDSAAVAQLIAQAAVSIPIVPRVEFPPLIMPDTRAAVRAQQRNAKNMRAAYARAQNTKFNMATRNYKGHKK